jgi:hypothetical protein
MRSPEARVGVATPQELGFVPSLEFASTLNRSERAPEIDRRTPAYLGMTPAQNVMAEHRAAMFSGGQTGGEIGGSEAQPARSAIPPETLGMRSSACESDVSSPVTSITDKPINHTLVPSDSLPTAMRQTSNLKTSLRTLPNALPVMAPVGSPRFGAVSLAGRFWHHAPIWPLEQMLYQQVDAEIAAQARQNASHNKLAQMVLGRPPQAGDFRALVALHVLHVADTGPLWLTLWFHGGIAPYIARDPMSDIAPDIAPGEPTSRVASDAPEDGMRVPRPVMFQDNTAAIIRGARLGLGGYRYDFTRSASVPVAADGGPNICFNPWLEGGLLGVGHGAPPGANAHASSSLGPSDTAGSHPNAQPNGLRSNCVNCHQRAGWPPRDFLRVDRWVPGNTPAASSATRSGAVPVSAPPVIPTGQLWSVALALQSWRDQQGPSPAPGAQDSSERR